MDQTEYNERLAIFSENLRMIEAQNAASAGQLNGARGCLGFAVPRAGDLVFAFRSHRCMYRPTLQPLIAD